MQTQPQESSEQQGAATNFVRLPSVLRRTSLGRSTIYRLIADGKFPKPKRLSDGAVGWRESDLDIWCETRPASR